MGLIPPLTQGQKREAIAAALDEMSAMGITSMTEPALGPGGDSYQGGLLGSECIGAYQDLLDAGPAEGEGERPLPVGGLRLLLARRPRRRCSPVSASTPASATRSCKIGGIKIFADGIPPNRTAWVSKEYVGGRAR